MISDSGSGAFSAPVFSAPVAGMYLVELRFDVTSMGEYGAASATLQGVATGAAFSDPLPGQKKVQQFRHLEKAEAVTLGFEQLQPVNPSGPNFDADWEYSLRVCQVGGPDLTFE